MRHQVVKQSSAVSVGHHAQLTSARLGRERREDFEIGAGALADNADKRLEVGRHAFRAFHEGVHTRLLEQVERHLVDGHVQDGRIAHLPRFGAWHRYKFWVHFEATLRVVTPPAFKPPRGRASSVVVAHMALVDEHA